MLKQKVGRSRKNFRCRTFVFAAEVNKRVDDPKMVGKVAVGRVLHQIEGILRLKTPIQLLNDSIYSLVGI